MTLGVNANGGSAGADWVVAVNDLTPGAAR